MNYPSLVARRPVKRMQMDMVVFKVELVRCYQMFIVLLANCNPVEGHKTKVMMGSHHKVLSRLKYCI